MAVVNINSPAGQAPAMAPPMRTDDQIFHASDRCQLDEQWFVLTKDTLMEALQITPVNSNQTFISPPSSDVLINFVNELGYAKLVRNLSNVVTNDMFQPWRALTTIINMCLTGKTSGFKRPRAHVLQILWGVITRAHIDYAERIWEEFTQSIYTLIDNKWNLTQHTSGKNNATLIMIPKPVLRYLKFSAMGTKREVFRLPIPGSLITADIQEASYYQEYLENVAKHRRYLAGETGTKPQKKKHKLTTESSNKPSKAEKSKYGFVSKKRTLKSMAESVAKDAPGKEPHVYAEDADMQKALEESLKSMYDVPRGPLPPVVIREPESGKYQPLPKVPGKGEEKVTEEQVAHDLLILQKPKKKSPSDQYIFQRRTSTPTRSSRHDESLYAELGLSYSEEESEKVVPVVDVGGQGEGQAGPDPGAQAEGQTGLDANPGNAGADEQPMSSPVVHAGSNREHMDLDVSDVSPQPSTEQMDEGFTATAYPKVQDNLKLTVEEPMLLEEPASSSGTLSSLQHLSKDINFGDLFFSDKPSKGDNDKVNAETEVESMVSVMIQQDMSSIPPMKSPIIDLTSRPESLKQSTAGAMMMKCIDELEHIMANLIQKNKGLEERDLPEADMKEILYQCMWETESYKSHEDHMQLCEALEKLMNHDHSEELAQDLAEARKKKKKSHESSKRHLGLHLISHLLLLNQQDHLELQELLELLDPTKCHHHHLHLHPPIKKDNLQIDEDMALDEQAQSLDDEDIGSAHIPKVNLRQDWWKPLEEERPATPEPTWSIPLSNLTVPTNNWASALASNYSPPPEDSLLGQTGDIATFMDWFCKRRGITELKPQDLEGPAFEIIKVFHPDVIHQYQMEECHKLLIDSVDDPILRYNVSKPLPLGGLPGQVTIQSDIFFNKDLEYLRYGNKGSRPALSITKMKAAYYPDAGLEQMVPDQFWIEEECKYDIAVIAVRTHMRILSVVRIEIFSMYGYDYMKKIVLRRVDLNEHVIVEQDFKYLYPSDFEDLYLLNLQGHLNHLPPKDKKIFTTAGQGVQDESRFKYEVLDQKDVDRSKAFMFSIQKRLKTRRIFCNLESFVGRRVREGDYRLLKRTE
nr:hypothetical protein [Tanacetum cinerariifolium]